MLSENTSGDSGSHNLSRYRPTDQRLCAYYGSVAYTLTIKQQNILANPNVLLNHYVNRTIKLFHRDKINESMHVIVSYYNTG